MGQEDQRSPTAAKEKVLGPAAAPMTMTTVVVTVVVVVVMVVEDGKGERKRWRKRSIGEAKREFCSAWTCASLHGRPGDSLSAR